MDQLVGILINSVIGGGGGFLGNLVKKNGLSLVANLLAGAVGGNLGNVLAGVAGLVKEGDSDFSLMSIITSLIGGGAGSLIGGLLGKKQA